MAEKKRIGDVLKEAGLVDDFQLESALSHQRNWGGKLGGILVDMGALREEDITRVLAERLRIPSVNLFEPEVPEAVIRLIKPDLAKKYAVVPAGKDGGAIVLATADPLDIKTLDEIRFITGLPIKPAMASESDIRDAIRKYYDHEKVIRRVRTPEIAHAGDAEPMEIFHGTGDVSLSEPPPRPEPKLNVPGEGAAPDRDIGNIKLHLESLITLLIETGLVKREDLLRIIEQKKIGQ